MMGYCDKLPGCSYFQLAGFIQQPRVVETAWAAVSHIHTIHVIQGRKLPTVSLFLFPAKLHTVDLQKSSSSHIY